MVNHSHWRSWWGMQEAEQRIIRCQGDWSHSPRPLRAFGTKPALWSATGCDIYSHFYRLGVASHPNATCEFLDVISSCLHGLLTKSDFCDSVLFAFDVFAPFHILIHPIRFWNDYIWLELNRNYFPNKSLLNSTLLHLKLAAHLAFLVHLVIVVSNNELCRRPNHG